MINAKSVIVGWLFLIATIPVKAGPDFLLYDGQVPISFHVGRKVPPVVTTALRMFAGDMLQVTGQHCVRRKQEQATIRIIEMDREPEAHGWMQNHGIPVQALQGRKDAFFIKIADGKQLTIVGSDARGTAYGILEVSRLAGVSPWIWWSDVRPERKSRITLPADYHTFQAPSVEYRGIFLNDEDWSLQPWSWQNFSPGSPGLISAAAYKKIFQLLMRLRANIIWPGMHGISTPFYFVPGAKETADSCGIMIGTSHCEPLMRNNVGEWNVAERGEYNYMTNRKSVQDYWAERLKTCGQYANFYTVGMRGIHDSEMEGVHGMDEQTRALQQVIEDQRRLLARYVDSRVERIPQQFVPYKEVLQIMENGLKLPDDITLTWCDDNYGYMTRLSDSLQQRRSGGAGIYYHLSYWGRPHDYMWLTTTQPGLIYNEMWQAYDHNVRRLWIVNVHDLKTPAYDLEFFLDMAWNINSITSSTIWQHQEKWLAREFTDAIARSLMPAMKEFWRLTAIRKPEFMGWNQVELDKRKYTRGWSPVSDTEFSLTAFGDELDRYLADWRKVEQTVLDVEASVPDRLRDAYFSHVKYPLLCAQAMSVKMLEAQRARSIAAGTYDSARWQRDEALYTAAAKSMNAYRRIRSLTQYWNQTLAGGKWQHSMCDAPRDLFVFYAPTLPVALSDEENARYGAQSDAEPALLETATDSSCVVRNACQYTHADPGAEKIQNLGHSMLAVALPKGKSLTYEFTAQMAGEALLRTAVIPTHPSDKGDIRFSVAVDEAPPVIFSFKEGFRSEGWKQNVLRGQAIRTTLLTLAKGPHTLTVTALDDHVVIDQWMIDFRQNRSFYVFPVSPAY